MIKGKKNRTGVPGIIGILIFGIMLVVWGMWAVVKGKLPFISRHHNVEKVSGHARVEGGAVLCVGIAIAAQYFIAMQPVTVVVIIFMICIIALVLEIALKVL
ncbi:hypothetical protein [Blautia producta]|uniref:hypothetical protein n=1 Tax=Blautia producta TaxID=33035 RepID=UPI0031B62316